MGEESKTRAAESASGTPGRFSWLRAPIVAWIVVVAIAATLLSVYGYRSVSGDSNFYNELVMKLSQAPVSQWIAPKWGDNPHGPSPDAYIQDHLVGNLVLGLILVKCGIPAHNALTIVQMLCQILAIYVLAALARLFIDGRDANGLLWGLMVIPIFIGHGIRANHEQAVLLFTLLAIYGAFRMASDFRWVTVLALGMIAVFLINGAFVILVPLMAFPTYLIALGEDFRKRWLAGVPLVGVAILSVVLIGVVYEHLFRAVTGLEFFKEYWRIQIIERSVYFESELGWLPQKASNAFYYANRLFFYTLPWSLAAILLLLRKRFVPPDPANLPVINARERPRTLYLLLFSNAVIYVVVFACFDRVASRYIVPAYFLVASAMFVFTIRHWKWFHHRTEFIERFGVHQFAACLWFVLFFLHFIAK